ncbi:hypothetical protein KC349_g3207 [Hortaea werneckii]|nr:hypothetical protein KC349_g3207 [Hortaea werneckii]
MILSGAQIVARKLVTNLRLTSQQQQPCGVDVTLRHVSHWKSAATIEFDNSYREAAETAALCFNASDSMHLAPGSYLVDFNELASIPRNCMASVLPRSSLWRSGIGVHAGVIDAGYEGALGAMLDVRNPHGTTLYRNARLAQLVFEEMGEYVDGCNGIYQFSSNSSGRHGPSK